MDNVSPLHYILVPMTWHTFLRIVEFRTKIITFSTFVLALLSALWVLGPIPWHLTILLFITVLAVDMGTTAFNTFFEYEKGADDPESGGEDGNIAPRRMVAPGHALIIALGLFAFAGVLGLFLVIWTGWPLLVIGLVCFTVAFLFSGGKKPLGATPWAEVIAGFFLGTVLWVVVFYVLSTPVRWDPNFWWRAPLMSLPSFFYISSILLVKNCCDRNGDFLAGRKTLAVLWGPKAQVLVPLLPLASYITLGILGACGIFPWTFLISAILGPALTIPAWRAMVHRGFSHHTKGENLNSVSQAFLIFTLVSVVGWAVGIALR